MSLGVSGGVGRGRGTSGGGLEFCVALSPHITRPLLSLGARGGQPAHKYARDHFCSLP